MAYTFLTLAQKVRRKCRISGTGPSAVTGQSEEYNRVLDWVNEAYMDIVRSRPDWTFMRRSATCVTVQGQTEYSPTADFALTDFGFWALDYTNGDTFRNYSTSAGTASEIPMELLDYDEWRDTYLLGALRSTFTRPLVIAQAPDRSIVTGPIAAAGYTLVGDYYRAPAEMVLAADEPVFEDRFRFAIVYRAMMMYGISESAPEIFDEGEAGFNKIIREMEGVYLRRPTLGGALC